MYVCTYLKIHTYVCTFNLRIVLPRKEPAQLLFDRYAKVAHPHFVCENGLFMHDGEKPYCSWKNYKYICL